MHLNLFVLFVSFVDNWVLKSFLLQKQLCERGEFFDVNCSINDGEENILRNIIGTKPDILAISCYLWNIRLALSLLHHLKTALPDLVIVLGGPEFDSESTRLLNQHLAIDYIVVGEGEKPFFAIVEALKAGKKEPEGNGIIRRSSEGKAIFSGVQRPMTIEEIPSPHIHGGIPSHVVAGSHAMLETQRGCPLRCAFCYYPGAVPKLRQLPLDRVFLELEAILKQKPKRLYLMDPAFNANLPRAKAILREIIRLGKELGELPLLHTEMIPEFLDEEMILLCREAELNMIEVGIQSLNPDALVLMGRFRDEEKLFSNINFALKNGVNMLPQLIYGLPGDDFASILSDFDRVYRLPTKNLNLFGLHLLPGTEYRARAKELGIRYRKVPPYDIREGKGFSRKEIKTLDLLSRLSLLLKTIKPQISQLCELSGASPSGVLLGFQKENRSAIRLLDSPETSKEAKANLKLDLLDKMIVYCRRNFKELKANEEFERILEGMTQNREMEKMGLVRKILAEKKIRWQSAHQ